MNNSISEMTPEELRIACAEKMGWRKSVYSNFRAQGVPPDGDGATMHLYPRYDTDRNALQELIVAVPEERRKGFLDNILVYSENTDSAWWSFLTASPEAIMRAFLYVMEESRK